MLLAAVVLHHLSEGCNVPFDISALLRVGQGRVSQVSSWRMAERDLLSVFTTLLKMFRITFDHPKDL